VKPYKGHSLLENSQHSERALVFDSSGCNNRLEFIGAQGILGVTGLSYAFKTKGQHFEQPL
jgi:hypothetical protein